MRPTDTVRSSDGRETARSQTERALAVYREQAAALAEMETRQRSDPAFDFADDSLAIRQQLIATIA
ncbi:MAG: hypothetical protein KDE35_10950 [Geminicoccaceae bacterium]|nr:hypothetical protein [Geminicoccaceae bacterium]